MHPDAGAVLEALDGCAAEMVGRLRELVRLPSVGGTDAEHDAQALLASWWRADGLEVDHWQIPLAELEAREDFPGVEVERREAWGVVGRLPASGDGGRSLLLDGHVDVVPASATGWTSHPFGGEVADGDLVGRGACDMKGGLIAAVWAVTALSRAHVRLAGDVLLAGVEGEEDGGLGTYALLDRGWRADCCVIPEPTGLDVAVANAGSLMFRLTVRGRPAHASRRDTGVSSVELFVPVLQALGRLEAERNAVREPLLERWGLPYALSVGRVRAGDWASTVPGTLVAEGRLGVVLDEPVEQARAALEAAVARACEGHPWLREHPVVVEWWGGISASGRCPADSDLPQRVAAAHDAGGGGALRTWAAPYGSDLRLFAAAGIPTVQYGPGDIDLAHAVDERVPLAEVRQSARTLALLALDRCGTVTPER